MVEPTPIWVAPVIAPTPTPWAGMPSSGMPGVIVTDVPRILALAVAHGEGRGLAVPGVRPSSESGVPRQTPLTVGSPQEVLERTLGFRDYAGHYQRQLFLVDHAGLPLKTVLEQLDLLGEILPEMRKGFAEGRPAHIPEAPTHASLVAAAGGAKDSTVYAPADSATGHRAEDAEELVVAG